MMLPLQDTLKLTRRLHGLADARIGTSGTSGDGSWPSEWLEGGSPEYLAVMEPPYIGTHGLDSVNPLQRPELRDGGELTDDAKATYADGGWRTVGGAGQREREGPKAAAKL